METVASTNPGDTKASDESFCGTYSVKNIGDAFAQERGPIILNLFKDVRLLVFTKYMKTFQKL